MKESGLITMQRDMLRAIALMYPFSIQDIYEAYGRLKSYDLTLKACEMARDHFVSLSTTGGEVLEEKNGGSQVCCDAMAAARTERIIHGNDNYRDGSSWISNPAGDAHRRIFFCPFCGDVVFSGES